eukprot:TRINITY_DN116_c0_g1_i5.p1 TRINITY_DN116_c0_g1~~TRINITY_DN116_c0_g1_i5.p1  ORF type:complete len:167 (-),score=36.75 TRINITY_DN116_c0_g1_i5:120-620(-)
MQPGMMQQGMMQPGMMQPGMMQPGMSMSVGGMGMSVNLAGYVPPMAGQRPVYPTGLVAQFPTMAVGPGMYIKQQWSDKREKKLYKIYHKAVKDGVITPKELKKCLIKFGYMVNDMQAMQILYTLDTNRDGHISYQEFNSGVKRFAAVFPRTKGMKQWRKANKHLYK